VNKDQVSSFASYIKKSSQVIQPDHTLLGGQITSCYRQSPACDGSTWDFSTLWWFDLWFFYFFFFFVVLGFELGAYILNHSISSFFVIGFFEIVSQTICPGFELWSSCLCLLSS
jgi:hypothetical protein